MGDRFRQIVDAADEYLEAEFAAGYRDGRESDTPEPTDNRTDAYKHSFRVGRAERSGDPIPYVKSICDASNIRQKEISKRMSMIVST